MSEGFSINFGSALPYLEEKFLRLIGRDAETRETKELLQRHVHLAFEEASTVQIIGMDEPVPILEIYQPSHLTRRRRRSGLETGSMASLEAIDYVDVQLLLEQTDNAVIVGRAGQGKTVLLHYLFTTLATSELYVPLLFTLRRVDVPATLTTFVRLLAQRRLPVKKERILLLVDGFDEISKTERQQVAAALREFTSLKVKREDGWFRAGQFFLTCREFYDIDDISAAHLEIAPFTRTDAVTFVTAFGKAYRSGIDPVAIFTELERYDLTEFATHPLTLAMVCILKSGPIRTLPRTPLELIQAAILTLTHRWDDSKGITRETQVDIKGEDRVRCMAAVAYAAETFSIPSTKVKEAVRKYLDVIGRPEVDTDALLREISQWFGILIPITFSEWTFVHRTFHDYLAARYWVASGFEPGRVKTWDARAAMAISLIPDATEALAVALVAARELHPLTDALRQGAVFIADSVAPAIIEHFRRFPQLFTFRRFPGRITAYTPHDFFDLATVDLLYAMAMAAAVDRTDPADLVMAYTAAELKSRGLRLPADIAGIAKETYRYEPVFDITRGSQVFILHLGEVI